MTSPSSLNLYLSALVACLTASLFGYSVGFIGGIIVLPSFLSHYHLSSLSPALLAAAQSRIVSFWLVGAFLGVLLGMPVTSRLGRKPALFLSSGLYVLGAVLQVLEFGEGDGLGLSVFELGRVVNGLGVGVGTLVSPMFISEISPAGKRAMLMSGYQTILQLSALGGFWIAFASNSLFPDSSTTQFRLPVAAQLVPGVLLLLGTLWIPETPRFLAEKGRMGEVQEVLVWLRGVDEGEEWVVEGEMKEIEAAKRREEEIREGRKRGGRSVWREVFGREVRGRLGVGVGLMVAQNMVGLNALNYYAPVIFMSAGFTSVSASLFLTGVFGFVKLFSAIAFMFVFVRVRGNRFWLLLGSGLCGACMFILAYFVKHLPPPSELTNTHLTLGGVISVLTVYVFAFSFSVSLGPISWNVCSEIFPPHLTSPCLAITTSTQWIFQIVIAAITPGLLASVGYLTYVLYAACCVVTFVWVWTVVPETRGVGLGKEMDAVFGVKNGARMEVEVEEVEDTEATALLRGQRQGQSGERERRGSLGTYT